MSEEKNILNNEPQSEKTENSKKKKRTIAIISFILLLIVAFLLWLFLHKVDVRFDYNGLDAQSEIAKVTWNHGLSEEQIKENIDEKGATKTYWYRIDEKGNFLDINGKIAEKGDIVYPFDFGTHIKKDYIIKYYYGKKSITVGEVATAPVADEDQNDTASTSETEKTNSQTSKPTSSKASADSSVAADTASEKPTESNTSETNTSETSTSKTNTSSENKKTEAPTIKLSVDKKCITGYVGNGTAQLKAAVTNAQQSDITWQASSGSNHTWDAAKHTLTATKGVFDKYYVTVTATVKTANGTSTDTIKIAVEPLLRVNVHTQIIDRNVDKDDNTLYGAIAGTANKVMFTAKNGITVTSWDVNRMKKTETASNGITATADDGATGSVTVTSEGGQKFTIYLEEVN